MNWIQTISGQRIDPFRLIDPDLIRIEDIAHSLACTNRFNGHTKFPYPVGQHCLYVASFMPPKDQFYGLTHDGGESIVGDMVFPLKSHPSFYIFKEVEHSVQAQVYEKFGLYPEEPDSLKVADRTMGLTEGQQLVGNTEEWSENGQFEPYDLEIIEWPWRYTKQVYLMYFYQLSQGLGTVPNARLLNNFEYHGWRNESRR